jgi:GT2 family glycosyltransferase
VVVCTRDRGRDALATIESLLESVGIELEIIVIDQSTNDDTESALAPACVDARVRYSRSSTVGLSRARNLGLQLAQHEIVLFTDDDVTVPVVWAERLSRALEECPQIAVGFCRVEAAPHDRSQGFVPDHLITKSIIVRSLWTKSLARGIGAGMVVRRRAIQSMGGFDELLGAGAPFRSAEDRDMAARALTAGWWVYQTPSPAVVHHGFRTWSEGQELTRRDWYGIGAAYAKQIKIGDVRIIPVIAHEVLYYGMLIPVVHQLMGRRRTGLRRLAYFSAGLFKGIRTPLDRSTLLYGQADKRR